LTYLEEPAAGPDPDRDEFSLHDRILFLWIYFDIILGLQVFCYLQMFHPKSYKHFFPHVCAQRVFCKLRNMCQTQIIVTLTF